MEPSVIHEDNHLLALGKPAGLLVQGDRSGDPTLLDWARSYLKTKYAKPGNVYVGLVHRLDRNVSGIVLLARTSKAAGRLSTLFRDRKAAKTYLAVTQGHPPTDRGELRSWLATVGDARGVTRIAREEFPGAREGVLAYRVLDERGGRCLVEVRPRTGRRHQIRAQFAQAGCPLLGDVKYGAPARLPDRRLGLHALRLALAHPVGGAALELEATPDQGWPWPRVRHGEETI
ncbi:MAG: RluA family pseudouridine synthase [bacterium]|nr:RluA family pseudouridine synthase [bacterium]